jgi:hypothetical protein
MAYGDSVLPQQQRRIPPQQEFYDDGSEIPPPPGSEYIYPADPYRMQRENTDTALQVRKVQYSEIDRLLDNELTFDDWITSRRIMLSRASRIPGVDDKTYRWLFRKFIYLVGRAHSEGKTKILRAQCELFDFGLELLVSKGDVEMKGLTGISAMITAKNEMKQDIRLPPPAAPAKSFPFFPSLLGGKK